MSLQSKTIQDNPISFQPDSLFEIYQSLHNKYDYKWLNWEPETISKTLAEDGLEYIPLEKVYSIQTFLMSDAFFTIPFAFEKVVVAVSGRIPNFMSFDHVSFMDICDGIKELKKIPERVWTYFDDDVIDYIVNVFRKERVFILPRNIFMDDQYDDAMEIMNSYLSSKEKEYVKTHAKILKHIRKMIEDYIEDKYNEA